jgi:hypothetical protein
MFCLQLVSLLFLSLRFFGVLERAPQFAQNLLFTFTHGLLGNPETAGDFGLGVTFPEEAFEQVSVGLGQASQRLLELFLFLFDREAVLDPTDAGIFAGRDTVANRVSPFLAITRQRARQNLMIHEAVQGRAAVRVENPDCVARRRDALGVNLFPPVRNGPARRDPPAMSSCDAGGPDSWPIRHVMLKPAVHRLRERAGHHSLARYRRLRNSQALLCLHDSRHAPGATLKTTLREGRGITLTNSTSALLAGISDPYERSFNGVTEYGIAGSGRDAAAATASALATTDTTARTATISFRRNWTYARPRSSRISGSMRKKPNRGDTTTLRQLTIPARCRLCKPRK